jgi:hypothetical protein
MSGRFFAALVFGIASFGIVAGAYAEADPAEDPGVARIRDSFKVDGIALFDPHTMHAARMGVCAPSIFAGLKWCVSGTAEETKGDAAYVKTTGYNIESDGRIVYAISSRRSYPLKRDEFDGVIQAIGERYGAGAAIYAFKKPGEAGVEVNSLIAVWGGLRLVHLTEAEYAVVEGGGSLKRGHLVDHRFNLVASAKQRDPVYKIEGGAGFILHLMVTSPDRADVITRAVYAPAFLPPAAKPSAESSNPLVTDMVRRANPAPRDRTASDARRIEAERGFAAERLLREEAERKVAEERAARAEEKSAREEAERKAEAQRKAFEEEKKRLESEKKAAEERAKRAEEEFKVNEDRRRKEESERAARAEAERKAAEERVKRAERERMSSEQRRRAEEADRAARAEAERKAAEEKATRAEVERKALEERRRKEEAERKAAEEAARRADAQRAEAERKAAEERRGKEKAERKAAEERAKRAEGERKVAEDRRKAQDAERAARAEAERKAAEEKARRSDAERAAQEGRKDTDERASAERKAEAERLARERKARPESWYLLAADAAKAAGAIWSLSETQDRVAEERTLRTQTIFGGAEHDAAGRLAVEVTFECTIIAGERRLRAVARGFDRKSGTGVAFKTEGEGTFGVRTRVRLDDRPPQDGFLFRERQDDTASILEIPMTSADLGTKTPRGGIWLRHYAAAVEFNLVSGTVAATIAPYADNLRRVLEACAE